MYTERMFAFTAKIHPRDKALMPMLSKRIAGALSWERECAETLSYKMRVSVPTRLLFVRYSLLQFGTNRILKQAPGVLIHRWTVAWLVCCACLGVSCGGVRTYRDTSRAAAYI